LTVGYSARLAGERDPGHSPPPRAPRRSLERRARAASRAVPRTTATSCPATHP